jgi:hypothetical protein
MALGMLRLGSMPSSLSPLVPLGSRRESEWLFFVTSTACREKEGESEEEAKEEEVGGGGGGKGAGGVTEERKEGTNLLS